MLYNTTRRVVFLTVHVLENVFLFSVVNLMKNTDIWQIFYGAFICKIRMPIKSKCTTELQNSSLIIVELITKLFEIWYSNNKRSTNVWRTYADTVTDIISEYRLAIVLSIIAIWLHFLIENLVQIVLICHLVDVEI